MTHISDLYLRQVYQQFKHFATWVPNERISLGDIGTMKGRYFSRMASLKDFGVSFTALPESASADQSYSTANQVQITGSLDQPSLVGISFKTGGATYLQLKQCRTHEIENLLAVGTSVRSLHESGDWDSDLVIVTKVLQADAAVILVAGGGGAAIELSLPVGMMVDQLALAAATGSFAVKRESGIEVKHFASETTTPWFKVAQLRRAKLKFMSGQGSGMTLTPLKWDDFQ